MQKVIVVLSACFYNNLQESRFALARKTCMNIAQYGKDKDRSGTVNSCGSADVDNDDVIKVFMIIVDDSKLDIKVKENLEGIGNGRVIVKRQLTKGRKGAAVKDAIRYGLEFAESEEFLIEIGKDTNYDLVFCLQEIEKCDMIHHLRECTRPMFDLRYDVVIPARLRDLFQESYAREQFFSESFGNAYLNNIWKSNIPEAVIDHLERFRGEKVINQEEQIDVDFYFGPILWRAKEVSQYWLEYNGGDQWDVQVVPLFQIGKLKGKDCRIASMMIQYKHDEEQKSEEERNALFCSKRLYQLNNIIPKVEETLAIMKREHLSNANTTIQSDSKIIKLEQQ